MQNNLKEAVDRLECAILGKESYEIAGVSVSNLRVVLGAVKADEDAEFVRMLADAKAAGVTVPAPSAGSPVAWRVTHYDGSVSYCRNKVSACGGPEPDREVIPLYAAPVPAPQPGDLHDAIMNLTVTVPSKYPERFIAREIYAAGWSEGRHAAAELVAASVQQDRQDAERTEEELEADWEATKAELRAQYPGIAGEFRVFGVLISTERGGDPVNGDFQTFIHKIIHGVVDEDDTQLIREAIYDDIDNLKLKPEGETEVIVYESGEREDVFWSKFYRIAPQVLAARKEPK